MIPKQLRERVKAVPVLGPLAYQWYLRLRYDEGEVLEIIGGPLRGMRWKRFMRTFWPGYVSGEYEPQLLEAILREARPGSTFYDIGANAGLMSLAAGRAVGASGKVVAVEPHPETAVQLRAQLELNQLRGVEVLEAAVSNEEGFAELEDQGSSDVLALRLDANGSGRTIRVPTTTVDAMAQRYGAPDAMKIDVEGADMLVLAGARQTLEHHHPVVLMEIHTEDLAPQYEAFMAEFGYRHYELDGTPIEGAVKARHVLSRCE